MTTGQKIVWTSVGTWVAWCSCLTAETHASRPGPAIYGGSGRFASCVRFADLPYQLRKRRTDQRLRWLGFRCFFGKRDVRARTVADLYRLGRGSRQFGLRLSVERLVWIAIR